MSAVEMPNVRGDQTAPNPAPLAERKTGLLEKIMEESLYNWVEEGQGKVGLIGCGLGYTWVKEAEQFMGAKLPLLKLGTLPLPRKKLIEFAGD